MDVANLLLDFLRVVIWPITLIVGCVMFRSEVVKLLARIHKASFPGGVSIDLSESVHEVKALSEKVQSMPPKMETKQLPTIPLTEANSRMIQLHLQPSPSGLDMSYYQNLVEQDPNLALAGLRMEIDILARNLAKGFKIEIQQHDSGGRLLRRLLDAAAITSDQFQLAQKVLTVCNAASHGQVVSSEQARSVIQSAEVLTDQYLSWLGWGFEDGWKREKQKN